MFGGMALPIFSSCPTAFQDEKLPLIVFLHGAGERGPGDGSRLSVVKVHGVPKLFDRASPLRAVTLSPQCPENCVWNDITAGLAELISLIAAEYGADERRVSLTGLSMGGYGSWELGMSHPELFSAIAPICGGGMPWRAAALKDIPVRAFHGDRDDAVPVSASYEMADAVNACGGSAQLMILHGCGHNCWTYAYEETNLIEWLASSVRK